MAEQGEIQPDDFALFAATCDQIKATRSKLEKVRILSNYFGSLDDADLKIAATFLSGKIFAPGESEDVNIGYSLLWNVVSEITDFKETRLSEYYLKHGDLGSVAEEIIANLPKKDGALHPISGTLFQKSLTLKDVESGFRELAKATGSNSVARKKQILFGIFSSIRAPNEAKYIVKLLTGEMRIGLVEGLVEEAIAKLSAKTLRQIRSANLIIADAGSVAILARHDKLNEAKLVPLRPTNFMLADTAETADLLFKKFKTSPVISEYKYDGIRAQIHLTPGLVKIFSRNLEDVTRFFPELEKEGLSISSVPAILDGEIIAYDNDKPLPFQLLQRRLRKLTRSPDDVPIKFLGFDLLYYRTSSLLDEPLLTRMKKLRELAPGDSSPISFSQQRAVNSAQEVLDMFIESKSLGYEGLVVKDLQSPYTPGRRGSAWVKLKKELDTLDVVIVATEFGHGKRAGVLSDYTFAVSEGTELKVIGKAYSGLTDSEIGMMTDLLKSITLQDYGYRRTVKPQVVLEVAFDAIQKSDRHDSGYALRFPRIKRIRTDKSVFEIDSLDRVKQIYEAQKVKA